MLTRRPTYQLLLLLMLQRADKATKIYMWNERPTVAWCQGLYSLAGSHLLRPLICIFPTFHHPHPTPLFNTVLVTSLYFDFAPIVTLSNYTKLDFVYIFTAITNRRTSYFRASTATNFYPK